jgi:two-component system nitrate/nitrite sensor histidine kinase NarX
LNLKADVLGASLQESPGVNEAKVELAAMTSAIATAYAQVRAALTGLQRPMALTDDLAAALRRSVAEFRSATGIAADLHIAAEAALALPAVARSQVKHIVHEALTNIRRHAQASHVQVSVERSNDTACFVVADDGCGFDPCKVDAEHHLGLAIMHRRAMHCGGQLTVDSAPGAGTRIVASFPLGQGGKDEQ